MSASVRAGDVVARLGGDEFAVVAVDVASAEEAFLLAQRIRDAVSPPVELAGVAVQVEASIGIVVSP